MTRDVLTQLTAYGEYCDDRQGSVTVEEILRTEAPDASGPTVMFDATGDEPYEWEERERSDGLIVEYLVPRTGSTAQKRWIGVLAAAAATILVVVGVVVVADGDSGDVVTGPASSPSVDAPPVVDADVAASWALFLRSCVPVLCPQTESEPVDLEPSPAPEDQPGLGGTGDQSMRSVTVGGPGLVAVGKDSPGAAVWTSVDGITWSRVPHDEAIFGSGGARMLDVTVGGPGLVAVGGEEGISYDSDSDGVVWTSVDGLIWSRVPHDEAVFGGGWINSVIVAGPGLVAVGSVNSGDEPSDTGGDAAVWTSVDGITWSRVPHDDAVFGGADKQWMDEVIVGGPGLVAVGTEGKGWWEHNFGLIAAVWTSVDGIEWSRVAHDDAVFGRLDYESDPPPRQGMISVTAGGPGLVAVGIGGVWTSVDGITWSRASEFMAGSAVMSSVIDAGPALVAVGSSAWTSIDGIDWSRVPASETIIGPQSTRHVSSVITAGSGLLAVGGSDVAFALGGGQDAAVWTSVDGIAWSRVTNDDATGEAG